VKRSLLALRQVGFATPHSNEVKSITIKV